jgi:hypothetical protein
MSQSRRIVLMRKRAPRALSLCLADTRPEPLVLNVKPGADRLRFLELEILVSGCDIHYPRA